MRRVPAEYEKLGASILRKRTEMGLSQKYVATRTGTTSSYISQVEHGKLKASDKFLWKLEVVLALPEGTLFLKVGRLPMSLIRTMSPLPEQTDQELLNQLMLNMTSAQLAELLAYARFVKLHEYLQELST